MFPNTQKLCLTYTTEVNEYYITENKDRSKYTSWRKTKNGVEKIKTSTNPVFLEKDFI